MNVNKEDSQVTPVVQRSDNEKGGYFGATCPSHRFFHPPILFIQQTCNAARESNLDVHSAIGDEMKTQKHACRLNLEMRRTAPPAWDFRNATIWDEYADTAFVVANSLILLITSVVGIAANIFVVLAVYHQKSLQTSNNALVVNLAIVDLLRCGIDCPILFTIVMTVYQRGHVDELICDMHIASFSFSCCIQLLTLACISAERHQAIAQPFKTTQRKTRIMVLIPLTWILAILMSVLCLMYLRDSPVHMRCKGQPREKSSSYDSFGLFMLFPLWAACFAVITGFYARIFGLVKSHNRKIFDEGIFPLSKKDPPEEDRNKEETTVVENAKHEKILTLREIVAQAQAEPNSTQRNSSASQQPSEKPLQCISINSETEKEYKSTAEISDLEQPRPVAARSEEKPRAAQNSVPCAANGNVLADVKNSNAKMEKVAVDFTGEKQSEDRLKTNKESKVNSLHVSSAAPEQNSISAPALLTETKQVKLAVAASDQGASLPAVPGNIYEAEAVKPPAEVHGAVCMMPSKASKERARKKKESKMAKRAGYIIITFLIFWLPLITTILVNVVGDKYKNVQTLIIQDMEILSVSVACITSLSDPIIYAAVNPQFWMEFYRLKNRLRSILRKKL